MFESFVARRMCLVVFALLWVWIGSLQADLAAQEIQSEDLAESESQSTSSLNLESHRIVLRDGASIPAWPETLSITFTLPQGQLSIPIVEVDRISLAARPTDARHQWIETLIQEILSKTPRSPQAIERLEALGVEAYPQVKQYCETLPEGKAPSLEELLEGWNERGLFGESELAGFDVIEIGEDRLVGRVEQTSLLFRSQSMGQFTIEISDLAVLLKAERKESAEDEASGDVLPDPGSLTQFSHKLNEKLRFQVVGAADGSVWGSDLYTADSNLATAAVHAGALEIGESGIVVVEILPGENAYGSSVQNGISSRPWNAYSLSYRIIVRRRDR